MTVLSGLTAAQDSHSNWISSRGADHSDYVTIIDSTISDILDSLDWSDHLLVYRVESSLGGSVRLLAEHGYKQSLVSYARGVLKSGYASQGDYELVRKLTELIACDNVPGIGHGFKDAQHLEGGEVEGREQIGAVFTFLVGDEFAKAVWCPELTLWIDPQ
jgi:hypothetical protein